MATARPPSVIVLIDMPNHLNTRPVTTIESGIAVSVMNVVRKFNRNRNRMIDDQDAAVAQRVDDVVDAQVDERLLLIDFRVDADVGRQPGLQFLQRRR